MSIFRIRQSIVEQYIQEYAHEMQHMDEYTFPEVMLELQAKEAELQNITDHKSITAFSRDALENVFHCWFDNGEGDDWFEYMKTEECDFQRKEKMRLRRSMKSRSNNL
ncbi:MAG: hypothetical protein WCL18_05905 [bacterium]